MGPQRSKYGMYNEEEDLMEYRLKQKKTKEI
jgi:hypothetical protein